MNLKEKKMKISEKWKKNSALYGDLFVCFTYIFICKRFLFFGEQLAELLCVCGLLCVRNVLGRVGKIFSFFFSLFLCLSTSSDRRENGVGCFMMPHLIFLFLFFKNLLPARPVISQKSLINIDPNVRETDRQTREKRPRFVIIIGRCHAEIIIKKIIIFKSIDFNYYFPSVFPLYTYYL